MLQPQVRKMVPETKYARSGDLHIAYQVMGGGPIDLVFVPGLASHVEFQWEEPTQVRFFRRLASFSRLIRFDKRGTGLSDRVATMPTLEERMDDVRAVMDAADSQRAAILGLSEGGTLALVFAATFPKRTRALILWNASGGQRPGSEPPPPDSNRLLLEGLEQNWGTGAFLPAFVPSASGDARFRAWWSRFERLAMSPGAAVQAMRMNLEIDARDVPAMVQVPTLVIYNRGDPVLSADSARYMADRIAGAEFVELPGPDHFAWKEEDGVTQEVEEFLTGSRPPSEVDRSLATLLFTDIVGSTDRAAKLGDQRWRELLEQHDSIVRRVVESFRGRLVDSTGDGVLASFDGPARAIRCARAIGEELSAIGVEIRAGLHTGEVEARGQGLAGIAVHIGARVAALAGAGEVLVSRTVKDLVAGSGISFADHGVHELKGVPEKWHLFLVDE
jgi:pimeloyl-ACP methyl ester carboxylesterase